MDEKQFQDLYYIEHKWLPWIFFQAPQKFSSILLDKRGSLFTGLLQAIHKGETDYFCPIDENYFSVKQKSKDSTEIIQLTLPESFTGLLCKSIYLCSSFHDAAFYTIECTEKGIYLLCEWTKDGGHLVHENLSHDCDNEYEMVLDLFSKHKDIMEFLKQVSNSVH